MYFLSWRLSGESSLFLLSATTLAWSRVASFSRSHFGCLLSGHCLCLLRGSSRSTRDGERCPPVWGRPLGRTVPEVLLKDFSHSLCTTPNLRASGKCILSFAKFDVPDEFQVLVVMKEGDWFLSSNCDYLHKIMIFIFLTCLIFIRFQWNAFCLLLTCVCIILFEFYVLDFNLFNSQQGYISQ